jgi:ribosomal protein S18 acetylase RimI-like enzyme
LGKGETTVLVAEIDNQLIGFISFGLTRDKDVDKESVAEIRAIYLDPTYYRCGYGKLLCEAAITQLKANGYREVTLWVLDNYTPAISFYQALHFQKTDGVKIDSKSTVELKTRRFSRFLS